MAYQSVIAGRTLDTAVAGTVLDRAVLQRIAGRGESTRDVAALIGLPAALGIMQMRPELAPVLWEPTKAMLAGQVRAVLDAKRVEQAEAAELARLAEEVGLPMASTVDEDGHELDVLDSLLREWLSVGIAPPEASAD
jgi:hypothetical protein